MLLHDETTMSIFLLVKKLIVDCVDVVDAKNYTVGHENVSLQ